MAQHVKPRRDVDWCGMALAADWLVKHLTAQALLPGLTPGEIKDIKRRERAARERRRKFCQWCREEIRAKLARWEKPERPANQPAPQFHAGQRVVCVDASLNPQHSVKLLSSGKIYVIRAVDQKPGWKAPSWGVHLDGIRIIHPDIGCD
jgi:hypothetical protein